MNRLLFISKTEFLSDSVTPHYRTERPWPYTKFLATYNFMLANAVHIPRHIVKFCSLQGTLYYRQDIPQVGLLKHIVTTWGDFCKPHSRKCGTTLTKTLLPSAPAVGRTPQLMVGNPLFVLAVTVSAQYFHPLGMKILPADSTDSSDFWATSSVMPVGTTPLLYQLESL